MFILFLICQSLANNSNISQLNIHKYYDTYFSLILTEISAINFWVIIGIPSSSMKISRNFSSRFVFWKLGMIEHISWKNCCLSFLNALQSKITCSSSSKRPESQKRHFLLNCWILVHLPISTLSLWLCHLILVTYDLLFRFLTLSK